MEPWEFWCCYYGYIERIKNENQRLDYYTSKNALFIANRTFSKYGVRWNEIFEIEKTRISKAKPMTKQEYREWKKRKNEEWGPPLPETQAKMDAMIQRNKMGNA